MPTIKFAVREERKTDMGFPVVLYINTNGDRLRFYTDVYIKNIKFLEGVRISKKDPLYKEKNERLLKILAEVTPLVYKETDKHLLKQHIADLLGGRTQKTKTLIDHITEFMATKSHKRTAALYQGTINKILAFDPATTVESVNTKWLTEFENFCAQTMSINGYSIHFRNIRAVFNYLLASQEIQIYPFKTFKIKSEKTVHRALSLDMLISLKDCECAGYAIKYRDMFLLMVYLVGINPKDLLYLTKENINSGRIVYRRFKTRKLYSIKIEPEAAEIIKRYKGQRYLLKFLDGDIDYLSFVRNMNKALKKINSGLTSYWARHTWATIAFKLGVPKDIISLALGHSNGLKVTDIYIDYDLEEVDKANRLVLDSLKQPSLSSQTAEGSSSST